MFPAKRNAPGPGKTGPAGLSFIGAEVVISGDVTTTCQIHLDGRIDGDLRCATLVQSENGRVAGDILADEARIAGLVEGLVNARTVIVEATARVKGDVAYETISIAAGARIDGRLARREAIAKPGAEDPAVLIATPTNDREDPSPIPSGLLPLGERKRLRGAA